MEKRKYKRIKYADRQQIEAMYNSGAREKAIAEKIGVHIATIYKELERGKVIVADSVKYSADTAQRAIG
ncbi:MAG: helix-turn-helix domain-containing protein [Lachnospiraceae bacterium]|nr:helix-turn-helix domain-containing protein [Lachnospiraceae bacterium]